MATLTFQIPDALLLQSGESTETLSRQSQWLLALKFFELGRLTSGQAAQMCGMNRVDFILTAGKQGVCVADLDGDELIQEVRRSCGTG